MTADDLNAPLGQQPRKRRLSIPITTPQVMAGVLALFLGVFVVWAVVGDNPFGGEPMVVVPIDLHPGAGGEDRPKDRRRRKSSPSIPTLLDGRLRPPPRTKRQSPPAATKTVTIIDGKTGERQEVVIPAPANDAAARADAGPLDQKFLEMTPHGADSQNRRRRRAAGRRLRPAGEAAARQARRAADRAHRRRAWRQRQRHRRRHRQAAGSGDAGLHALWRDVAALAGARPRPRPRGPAAGADGAVRLSRTTIRARRRCSPR